MYVLCICAVLFLVKCGIFLNIYNQSVLNSVHVDFGKNSADISFIHVCLYITVLMRLLNWTAQCMIR